MAIIRHMRRSAFFRRQAGRPDKGNCLESGGIRGNMLTRRFAFVPPCGASTTYYLRKEDFKAWMVFVIIISSWLEQSSKRLLISDL